MRYLISFDDDWRQLPENAVRERADAAHGVIRAARAAGVWFFGCGLAGSQAGLVAADGSWTPVPNPGTAQVVGGIAILEVASREEAREWAARFARACRCRQQVRELLDELSR